MNAYYNEFDPKAATWLRELQKGGHITDGHVDETSIVDVQADALTATRCHFFAGIGGWDYALRLAGWPADRPVWTGSCPCQPFSSAGKGLGTADSRHLWPQFFRLIGQCRPSVCIGEQVASKAGRLWLNGVRADLESLGYAVGAADLCAAGVNAPHIRQRLYWVAYAASDGLTRGQGTRSGWSGSAHGGRLGYTVNEGLEGHRGLGKEQVEEGWQREERHGSEASEPGGVEYTAGNGWEPRRAEPSRGSAIRGRSNHWSNYDLVPCSDGKTRRIESGSQPLVNGFPGRVGLLRGYGNAIVPQVAAEFIKSVMEFRPKGGE